MRFLAAPLLEQRRMLTERDLSSVTATRAALDRIHEVNPRLRAFVETFDAEAVATAEAADRERADGIERPLLGVPIAVKDDIAVRGHATGRGLRAGRTACADDPPVSALRRAGAVIVGKTALSEGALWATTASRAHGTTRNPLYPGLTAGGSSGGSAAAVAGRLVSVALGSDMGGSIRIPAACCGVVGYKPARPEEAAAEGDWAGLRSVGPIARTVGDCETVAAVIAEARPPVHIRPTPRVAIAQCRIALPPSEFAARATAGAAQQLSAADFDVCEIGPPPSTFAAAAPQRFVVGARSTLRSIDPSTVQRRTRQLAQLIRLLPDRLPGAAAAERNALEGLEAFFDEFDALITPTITHAPPTADAWNELSALSALIRQIRWAGPSPIWNGAGYAAISVPITAAHNGFRPSVQVVVPPGREALMFEIAQAIESGALP